MYHGICTDGKTCLLSHHWHMNEKGIIGYDIIGDIHGHYDALEALLTKMDYAHDGTSFAHTGRKAIFVGDLIDRGSLKRWLITATHWW